MAKEKEEKVRIVEARVVFSEDMTQADIYCKTQDGKWRKKRSETDAPLRPLVNARFHPVIVTEWDEEDPQ